MKILITGAAGFIGYHLSKALLQLGHIVVGLDNINDYYDINLKLDRLKSLGIRASNISMDEQILSSNFNRFSFYKSNIENQEILNEIFLHEQFNIVCHLAAQPGVRNSINKPNDYVKSNLVGFVNIIECCRHFNIEHLVYASSSSVYGLNENIPYNENDNVDHPISLYAATKKSNELIAHAYSYLYNIPTTGLRFFTVYGPWGRPDMALYLFTKAIKEGHPINIYNYGKMERDFTYIDDIVLGILAIIFKPPEKNTNWTNEYSDNSNSCAPYTIFNIGHNKPSLLTDFIKAIELELKIKSKKVFLPLQPGDVIKTYADISKLEDYSNYKSKTNIKKGVKSYVKWFNSYYK